MAKWFRSVHPDQGCLLPADMRSWLPPDHLAFQVTGVVGQLDLAGFEAAYRADRQGQPPYDPAMMVGLLFYCYFKGIRSLRKIAGACIDDVGCRVICGGASPSHQAATEFRRYLAIARAGCNAPAIRPSRPSLVWRCRSQAVHRRSMVCRLHRGVRHRAADADH